jgi:hypothetical protein
MSSWTATTADNVTGTINWVQPDEGDDNLTRGIAPGSAPPHPASPPAVGTPA